MDGVNSYLTTKANLFFISFDSTKNSPRLHMNMNLGFFSSVGFEIGGIGFITKLFVSPKAHHSSFDDN